MRKIIVLTFLSLDGVMQAPGGPTEDTSGNFTHGGWTVPYFDEDLGQVMTEQMSMPFDLLLGRKTFEIFASYWPDHPEEGPGINLATKYVASNTLTAHPWEKTVFLRGDLPGILARDFGGLDILVNNVGLARGGDLAATTDADWQEAIDQTLMPAVRASKLAVPHMKRRGGGVILMIASIFGRETGGRMTYNAVKAAEISLAKSDRKSVV